MIARVPRSRLRTPDRTWRFARVAAAASGRRRSMAAGEHAQTLATAVAAWNRGDLDGYLELYDPEINLHGLAPGIDNVRSMYRGMFAYYPGSQLTIDDVLVDADKLACRYTVRGTNRKSGEELVLPGVTIMHFRDDRVIERWDFEGSEKNVA
jgi:predicted ester cyclase